MSLIHMIDPTKTAEPEIHLVRSAITERKYRPLLNNGMKIEDLNAATDQDTYTETLPDGKTISWVLPHKKSFPGFINKHFGENAVYVSNKHMFLKNIAESTDESPPFSYQILIRDYLRFGTPYRSLLLEHGLGSGKSRSAIMVAETFREQGLPVLILTPAFLRLNFMDEIQKWGGDDIKITSSTTPAEAKRRQNIIDDAYNFVHYNATGHSVGSRSPKTGEDIGGKGGVFEQLARLGIGFPPDSKYSKLFPYLNKKYGPLKPPTNMLIIIEEIHNLNRTFIAGTSKSNLKFYMYPLLLMASDCKIIGLSGTPIISSPFEMATLYNVLRGPIKTSDPARPLEYTLPQSETKYNELFVNYEGLSLTNTEVLMSRIIGLSSLFKGVSDDADRVIFPAGKDTPIIEELEMSAYQTQVHDEALAKEMERSAARRRRAVNLNGSTGEVIDKSQAELEPRAAYHTNSRQAINFAFPRDIPRPRPRDKTSFAIPALNNYVLEFSEPPNKIYIKMRDSGVDTSDIDSKFKEAVSTEDTKRQHRIISDIFKKAYPAITPTDKEWSLLSDNDQQLLSKYMGTYQMRLQTAIQELADKPEEYLVLKRLEKFSVKMAKIYRNIVGDIEHGAPHLVKDDDAMAFRAHESAIPVCEEYEEPITDETIVEASSNSDDDEDTDPDVATSPIPKVRNVYDPEDELPKHMDVFKTDVELERMGMRVTGGPALVYSFFNTVEGAGVFSKVLEAHGFEPFTDKTWDGVTKFENIDRAPRYAFIKGGMNPRLKAKVMRVFNSRANRHGQLIRVVFVTQAAAEGISLYHLRQIHIMEPHWDNVMIEQVIGRGFRLRSHRYLADKREREIQVYHYFAKRAADVTPMPAGQPTIDYIIKGIADRKSKLVSQLKLVRGAAAVDCKINSDYNNLGVQCFDFRGNAKGNAFTTELDADVAASQHVKKTTHEAITYSHFNFEDDRHGSATYIVYPSERVNIKITVRQGASKTLEAGVFYSVPSGWNVGDPVDPHDFKKKGYLIGSLEKKKLMFLDDVSRLNSTIEEI